MVQGLEAEVVQEAAQGLEGVVAHPAVAQEGAQGLGVVAALLDPGQGLELTG